MKILIFALIAFAGASTSASELRVLEETEQIVSYQYGDEAPFAISKERFGSSAEAASFCAANGMQLQELEVIQLALLLAVSGALTTDVFLKQAVAFEMPTTAAGKTVTGLWAWAGDSESVVLLYDGQGSRAETVPIHRIQALGHIFGIEDLAMLPAVCK